MEYWYYMKGGAQLGPIDDDELARLKADGTIAADTMVWKGAAPESKYSLDQATSGPLAPKPGPLSAAAPEAPAPEPPAPEPAPPAPAPEPPEPGPAPPAPAAAPAAAPVIGAGVVSPAAPEAPPEPAPETPAAPELPAAAGAPAPPAAAAPAAPPPAATPQAHAGAAGGGAIAVHQTNVGVSAFFKGSRELISDQYWLLVVIVLGGSLIGSVVPLILSAPMACGICICFLMKMRGQQVDFAVLFKGFDYFVKGILLALAGVVISILPWIVTGIVAVVVGFVARRILPPSILAIFTMLFSLLLWLLVSLVVTPIIGFAYFVLVDQDAGVWESVKAGYRGLRANLSTVIVLALISTVALAIGGFLCGIPAILLAPHVCAAWAYAYLCIFKPSEVAAA